MWCSCKCYRKLNANVKEAANAFKATNFIIQHWILHDTTRDEIAGIKKRPEKCQKRLLRFKDLKLKYIVR